MTDRYRNLLYALCHSNYEDGVLGFDDYVFREELAKDKNGTLLDLCQIYVDHGSSAKHIYCEILHVLSEMKLEEIEPTGLCIAVPGLGSPDLEIADLSIRCFENWECPKGANILKSIRYQNDMAEKRAMEVADWLEKGCP